MMMDLVVNSYVMVQNIKEKNLHCQGTMNRKNTYNKLKWEAAVLVGEICSYFF